MTQILLPPIVFLLLYRFAFDTPRTWKRERRSVHLTNLALGSVLTACVLMFGMATVALVQLPIIVTAAIAGVWLFSVQHRFEASVWERQDRWNRLTASLAGSSHLKLPRFLQWLTGNIGFHHVHHLSAKVPNYRLEACHRALGEFCTVTTLNLRQALSAPSFALWDEESKRMVRSPVARPDLTKAREPFLMIHSSGATQRSRNRKMASRFDPQAFLSKIGDGKTIVELVKDAIIFAQGDPADFVGYVQTGRVKLSVVSVYGKEAVVGVLGPGEFFGEGCLAGQKLRLASASTMEASVIVRISKADMLRLVHTEASFTDLFITHLLTRNARVEEDLVDQLFNSSEKRLARTLLLLANFGGEGEPAPILAKISQETLAEMVGTTRSRVNSFMNKFRKLGLIDYNGRIEVHRALLTAVLHDKPGLRQDVDGE